MTLIRLPREKMLKFWSLLATFVDLYPGKKFWLSQGLFECFGLKKELLQDAAKAQDVSSQLNKFLKNRKISL